MPNEHLRNPPLRPDGTPRVFWFDPEGCHIIRRLPDGTLEAIGWDCRHPVTVSED